MSGLEAVHAAFCVHVVAPSLQHAGEPIGFPSMETKFHNLAYVLQNEGDSYNMIYGQRCVHSIYM